MSEICIRGAAVADTKRLLAIQRGAYLPYIARMGTEPAPMRADLAAQITMESVDVLITDGSIAGYIVSYTKNDDLHVESVAVDPAYHGKGFGRRLLKHAEDKARSLGLEALSLYTNELMTENLQLYPNLGFVETGRRAEDGFQRVYFRKVL